MAIAVDLHSHSSYAGGVGKISLKSLAETMQLKGINVFGVGDCQFPSWQEQYQTQLIPTKDNLYRFPESNAFFIRQTEVIITASLPDYQNRIVAHHVILFPDDPAIEKFKTWLAKNNCKNTIARPFIVCKNQRQVEDYLFEIQAIDERIEIIPAHILTPDGILGSKNGLSSWKEFYGEFTEHIHAVETGLSADPGMLYRIPDLQGRAFISSSDCHSTGLNKVGREFTLLETDEVSYEAIIDAIRQNRIKKTAEFHPSEGRYYLTGHRADRHSNRQEVFYSNETPAGNLCPVCGKKMLTGVRDRARQLTDASINKPEPQFLYLVPLIEVIATALGVKSVSGRKVNEYYKKCLAVFGTEIQLWETSVKNIHDMLDSNLPEEIIKHIKAVKENDYSFEPPGFDGHYGVLKIRGNS